VFPEHKFHIVDVLQKRGHIVGMTGDGVNDAPALKKADCGIAVSGATDAARAAAAIVLMSPGLSVIIDAIKESRRIFQRMNSYAIYRIAETLRVLFFMTLAILCFNFFPLTAVMIVMLALLNDGAILSIAYDNVHYKDKPEAWNMRMVLGISTVLGVIGVVAAFGLFYLGERVFHLDRPHIQTLMYLKLSVAGHLTIFLTRTRGPFWSIRPAKILWIAVLGTQIVATLIAVYGLFMTPLGWKWAGFVWGYALLWFLLNDRIKLLAYRIFDPVKAVSKPEVNADPKADAAPVAEPEAKAEPKPEAKAESKPATQIEPKPGAKADPKPEIKEGAKPVVIPEPQPVAKSQPPSELTPKIAKRAYELYEEGGRKDASAVQDWEKAEREIRKDQAKSDPKPESEAEPKPVAKEKTPPEAKVEAKPEAKVEPKPENKAGPDTEVKEKPATTADPKIQAKPEAEPKAKAEGAPAAEPQSESRSDPQPAKADSKPEAKAEPKPETNSKPASNLTPQLVKRVHQLYEDLGRKDVQAVEDMEKAERDNQKDESRK
jgi:H+-transporting ATPase